MRCAIQASPEQTDLGGALGVERDRSKESGITVYGLDSLIRNASRFCRVSAQSDQSVVEGVDNFVESLNRALSRVCTV